MNGEQLCMFVSYFISSIFLIVICSISIDNYIFTYKGKCELSKLDYIQVSENTWYSWKTTVNFNNEKYNKTTIDKYTCTVPYDIVPNISKCPKNFEKIYCYVKIKGHIAHVTYGNDSKIDSPWASSIGLIIGILLLIASGSMLWDLLPDRR